MKRTSKKNRAVNWKDQLVQSGQAEKGKWYAYTWDWRFIRICQTKEECYSA